MVGRGNFGENDFKDLRQEIRELANSFDAMSERHGRDTVRNAIEEGVSDAFDKIVLDAREGAKRYNLPESNSIVHGRGRWEGEDYVHEMFSSSVIIASHEFGSGIYSINGRGTIDVPGRGYYIPKPRSKGPIRLRSHPGDSDEHPIIVDYVVHPGVQPKRFMHDALYDNENVIYGSVGGKVSQAMKENDITD